jgi:uncharacterized protein YbjT (DUF2867 family)
MNFLVVGASRGVGRATVIHALTAGHTVTAVARHADAIGVSSPNLITVSGDATDPAVLDRVIPGQDAVIITLGLSIRKAIGPPFAPRSYVLTKATESIVQLMQTRGVNRLICVTAISLGDSVSQCTPLTSITLKAGLHWQFQEKARQEQRVRASSLNWTIIRPTTLTNGPLLPTTSAPKRPIRLLSHVSRASVASVITAQATDSALSRTAMTVTFEPAIGDSLRWLAQLPSHEATR